MRLSTSILATVVLTGCAMHPSPAPVPDSAPARISAVASAAPAMVPIAPAVAVTDASRPGDVILAGGPVSTAGVPALTKHKVTRQSIAVFGDSLFFTPPVLDRAIDGPTWDMDVRSYETQERVAHYVSMFSGKSRSRITERLEHGTRYESMIRAKFRAGGLPEDMYYLALVESGFDPNAYSRAAAVGMWQFMTSTGRDMGMRIDWWVDERRDPVKSTVAAVRFIRGLRDQFGSLYLAAAAYNGGPGRVARGLAMYSDELENTQQAEDAFFVLAEKDYLRNETREYVPQLIAAALVAKEPIRYGMELHPLPPFEYDSVRVPGGTPLAAIARAAAASVAAIRELNPHFLRGMLPPGERQLVRIPVGSLAGFDSGLATVPKDERVGTHTVVSHKGETVDRIADAHDISSEMVESWNPHLRHLKPSGKLVVGQTLVLPTAAVASAAMHVPDPSIERYGGSDTTRLKTRAVKHGATAKSVKSVKSVKSAKSAGKSSRSTKSAPPARSAKGHGSPKAAGPARKSSAAKQTGTGSKAGARKKSSAHRAPKKSSAA